MTANKTPRGLGKGLGALLGDADIESIRKPVGYVNKEIVGTKPRQDTADILRIPAELIVPNPFQPRSSFDEEALAELAESIRTLGLIQPVTVRKSADGMYQIISGERRFRACRLAGMEMIPAYIRDTDDQGMLEMAIVENIQREDLDPIEIALSYQRLIEECHLTQEQLAGRVGKKRSSVTNYLRLLGLPARVQHDLKVGLVSVGHAKVILGVDDPKIQEDLSDQVIRGGLSVRQLEDRVRALGRSAQPQDAEEQDLPENYYRILEHMGRIFGDNISLKRSPSGKGSITLRFNSDAEMEELLKVLERQ
ncbi:MAG: ParB/RepB/Spo0J family partition protein [Bacteroidales bacterium]|nr:ParB/RepB/Spo0J family partition protein [Bacteroidales bacterium]MBP5635164.1 ParB/RepB/Spo0J family partition protein [Bacteroidales bacterium]